MKRDFYCLHDAKAVKRGSEWVLVFNYYSAKDQAVFVVEEILDDQQLSHPESS